MMPNSFLIRLGEPYVQSNGALYDCGSASLYVNEANPRFIKVTIGAGFQIFIGEALPENPNIQATSNAPAGTCITFSEEKQTITVACDRLGTAAVYWKRDKGSLLLSNRKENLISQSDEPDWSSIQQYLYTGFTIKSSTLIKGISQTEPDTLLIASLNPQLKLSITNRENNRLDTANEPTDLIEQIANQLSIRLSSSPPSVLMMSAGWDSRTLLLEGTSNLTGAYTHGDLSSREISLARKLTGVQRLDHLFVDVQSCQFDPALIDQMLHELGSGVFPIWFIAAQNIRDWKNTPIMSGVLGELLGGHYGLMSWGSRTQKLLSSLLLLNDSLVRRQQVLGSIERYCTPPQSHWFISNLGQDILDANRTETKDRAHNAINQHYNETGNWQRALEEFNMAHRGRQYILKQAQAGSSTVGYTIPFADESLVDLVRALDFKQRIHNKANQRMLKLKNPILLKEPMAATLISAKNPILFQELSRLLRIFRENTSISIGKKKPRLGWFNYEHLYQSEQLHSLTDSLIHNIWDKSRMHAALEGNEKEGIDAGSTLDMLCKVKTVDYYLKLLTTDQAVA